MGMIRILRKNEDALIAKLKRIRGGKWWIFLYLYYFPLYLLGLIFGIISILMVAVVCFMLIFSYFEQDASYTLSTKIDGILAIIGMSYVGGTVIHLCARVMYHMMRGKRDEAP